MRLVYVDSSCLVAIAFEEPGADDLARDLSSYDRLFAGNLLEAEVLSALSREGIESTAGLLTAITWVHPDRPLTDEYQRVLAAGYLRGADLWHVAAALFLDPTARELRFLSLDRKQVEVAARLGFLH